jgi:hypothetical protein
MKIKSIRFVLNSIALTGSLLLVNSAGAAVSGINTPAGSYAQIQFLDTTSLDPSSNPGSTSINQSISSWNGATYSLALTNDPVTLDTAQGDITAGFLGNSYSIALNSIVLTQAPLNTGFAHLIFDFSVEFQLDALGLPVQPTLFPNFLVNGTVQNTSGSFAAIKGFIDYYGVNTAGIYGVLETVNYNSLFNTPGPFSSTIVGVPVNGNTPLLVGGTTLTLVGTIDFMVDPANISVQTAPVPEPASGLLLGVAGLTGLLWRRRFTRASGSINL